MFPVSGQVTDTDFEDHRVSKLLCSDRTVQK